MNTMRCEQCGRLVDGKPCPFCQSTRVRPLRPGETTTSPLETASTDAPPVPAVPATPRPRAVPELPPAKSDGERNAEPGRPARTAEERRPEPPRPVKAEEKKVEPPRGTGLALPPRADALDDQPASSRERARLAAPPDVPAQPARPAV